MTFLAPLFSALHWLGVGLYSGSLVFALLVFQRIYRRYEAYRYIDNFRAEVITLYWRVLHLSFVLIVISGAALAGLTGKPLLRGYYGLLFSSKLVLWLLQLWLLQDFLKPFPAASDTDKLQQPALPENQRSWLAVFLLLLIALAGFGLKHLP